MMKKIHLSVTTLFVTLCGISHAAPLSNYQESEKALNSQYALTQSYLKDIPIEKNNLLNQQHQWLKARNSKCGFKENIAPNMAIQNCITQENQQRIQYIKSQYFNFNALEQNLIRPITFNSKGEKILANNDCYCDGQILKIQNNQLYIYSACDEKLTEPQIYNIIKKVKADTSVEYSIDTNKNKVADFTLSFVTSGQNTWSIVPKVYRKQDLIHLDFKVKYSTAPQIKKIKQDCGDFDG